jgi:hypothetical protein
MLAKLELAGTRQSLAHSGTQRIPLIKENTHLVSPALVTFHVQRNGHPVSLLHGSSH